MTHVLSNWLKDGAQTWDKILIYTQESDQFLTPEVMSMKSEKAVRHE